MIALLQFTGNQSVLNPHGPHAGMLAEMSWGYIGLFSVVWLITMGFVAIAVIQGRRSRLLRPAGSQRLLVYAGVSVPFAILIVFLIYSVSVGRHLYAEPYMKRGALTVRVQGKQWWWDVRYLGQGGTITARTANEIHIPVGQPVVVELISADVIHSFWVPVLAGKMDLIPGRTNYQWIQADRPGVYRGQCAEYCGAQHAHMGLEVIAEPPDQFARWLDRQKQAAVEPPDAQSNRGRQVFLQGPCAMCHAIRGTEALAQVGPDLTHVGARKWLAAATIPNNRGALGGWIVNAQDIKPGNHMPRITLPAQDMQDLIVYLEGLK